MLHSVKLCFNSHFNKAKTLILQNLLHYFPRTKPHTPLPPPMAVPLQLRHVFDLIDADGDGKISPGELRQVLLNLGQQQQQDDAMDMKDDDDDEAVGMIREMDSNGDGVVDLDEFLSVFGNNGNNNKNDDGRDDLWRETEIVEAFRVFDADGNGFISAEEVQRVLARLGVTGENCSLGHCREMITGVDRDGDGFVNLDDFKSMMTADAAGNI